MTANENGTAATAGADARCSTWRPSPRFATRSSASRPSRAGGCAGTCSSRAAARCRHPSAREPVSRALRSPGARTARAGPPRRRTQTCTRLPRPADRPLGRSALRGLDRATRLPTGRRPVPVVGSVQAAQAMTLIVLGRRSTAVIHDRAARASEGRLARSR